MDISNCPFCDGASELKFAERYFWVECKECHARTNDECCDNYEQGMAAAIEKVVESWNKRANNNGWISPDDYLPDKSIQVVVLADNHIWLGFLSYDVFCNPCFYVNNGGVPLKKALCAVQGWLPIPSKEVN